MPKTLRLIQPRERSVRPPKPGPLSLSIRDEGEVRQVCTSGSVKWGAGDEECAQTENCLESPGSGRKNSVPGGTGGEPDAGCWGTGDAELTATESVSGAARGEGDQPWPKRQPVAPGGPPLAPTRGRDWTRQGALGEGTRLPGGRVAPRPLRPRRCLPRPWPRWAKSRSPHSRRCAPRGGRRAGCPARSSSARTCPRSPAACGAGRRGRSPPPPPGGTAPTAAAATSPASSAPPARRHLGSC